MYRIVTILTFLFFSLNLNSQIVFMPQWYPQAQFAGFYVAQEKGFYDELDLDVTIKHPVSSRNAIDYLKNGEVDIISLFLISGLSHYANGIDLVNIAQLSQKSSLLLVAKKSNKIFNIEDFNGKNVGIWKSGFDELPRIFVKTNNLQVNWVSVSSSVNLFLMDGIDILTVTYYNEYNNIINSGIDEDELSHFFMNDYGFNVPEDGLYCTSKIYKNKQDEINKFYEASRKGWIYAKNNPEEALQIVLKVMKEERVASNYAHQKWMLEKMLELFMPDGNTDIFGVLSKNAFSNSVEILKKSGYLNRTIRYEDFFQPTQ